MAPPSQSTSLQIPPADTERGSSRQAAHNSPAHPGSASAYRPASVAVHSATPSSSHAGSSSSRRQQRASHSVVSGTSNDHDRRNGHSRHEGSPYPDVYSHPAAVAYAAAHPRRTIPKFGPYLLLQTLGEGEFGKVKLGLHCQWGEEVAVKLIRRGNVDSSVRMSKVEREIEVLRTLKHPNIVRLYDVIETDKYIGIILEYASGGELFDHILAHRHLRERDAAKLFSQLISGVWYIHQKKIVHRDLKLENLLLDRHRNVIITDFGFANRFEHRSDDLMQTSCGSPCYAAPELVISEGLYVGSAVDIWSCGVILYAMLAGYLPFDDDPANPDGDNINLLYRYIVNTPLSFPDFVSAEARDLLSLMLVPDPTRRANLDTVMRHPWLSAYHGTPRTDGVPNAFGKSVADLEKAAMEQHQQKRIAYQKQMKANAVLNNTSAPSPRSHSHRPEPTSAAPTSGRSRSVQPEFIYDSSVDQSISAPVPSANANATPKHNGTTPKAFDSPAALGLADDDPFAPPPGTKVNSGVATATSPSKQRPSEDSARTPAAGLSPTDNKTPSKGHRSSTSGGGRDIRHTIQVEYDEPKSARRSDDKRRDRSGSQGQPSQASAQPNGVLPNVQNGQPATRERRPSHGGATKPLPPQPVAPSAYKPPPTPATPKGSSHQQPSATPVKAASGGDVPTVNVSSPPQTPSFHQLSHPKDKDKDASSQNSASSKRGHKKGKSSIDKIGLGKIFGSGNSAPAPPVPPLNGSEHNLQSPSAPSSRVPSESQGSASSLQAPQEPAPPKDGKKSRRNTLTVMVEPFIGTIRNRKGRPPTTPATAEPVPTAQTPVNATHPPVPSSATVPALPTAPHDADLTHPDIPVEDGPGLSASSNKAKKVMQWFRTKSKGRESVGIGLGGEAEHHDSLSTPITEQKYKKGFSASSSTVNQTSTPASAMSPQVVVTQAQQATTPKTPKVSAPGHPQRAASSATETPSFVARFRNSVTVGGGSHSHSSKHSNQPGGQLRIHQGAVDQTTITTRPPPEVMAKVKAVLEGMGVEIQLESEYKYRCIRHKKKKGATSAAGTAPNGAPANLAAVQVTGSAASNGVDRRGLPLPSPSAFSATGGMLRGLLMRRQSSQVSSSSQPSLAFDDETSVVVSEPLLMSDITYGDPSQDAGDEVRFSVELTRIDRLNDTYSLDIRRLKGNLRSYKYLYDTIRQRADLQR
ncbi:CAMK/CAMK1 protein kinase [Coprinopsis cinerea AmutBmut pab1-1]|nr:CAMK/CAMK1 protein kinase [Coprinopsis cinerea AmutBmut pab1-1]